MSYLRYLCLSLSPVVCRRAHVLFTLFVFVFISSCLQEGSCLIYVICVCLYLQLFVGGHMSYLRYLCLSLSPVVCRRAHVLFTLFVFVFTSSCLQEGTCLIYVICVCLYLLLFVGGHMSYLRYLCLSLSPVVCRRAHVLFTLFVFVFTSSCLQEGTCLIYVICVCLYLQLFVGGHMSYLRYLCLSLSPVVCRRAHVLFTLFVFVFISSCLQEGLSYLRYLCLSLSPVVCRRAHVLFTLLVFVFISSCLQEGTCLIYVICVCLYLQLFVGGHMSYLRYLCLSLPPVVCRRAHVLFTLFVFVFMSSCLQEGTCLIYVICVCLYVQLFVGGHMSYLRYLCLSLSPVVCRRAHVLFTLFVFIFTSSCLQEGTCLIYVICVCLYVQLFVGGHMSYLRYLCLSLSPVVCRRAHVLFTLFVFVFTSSCLQEGTYLIYIICVCLYVQLFVGGHMSYLRYLCLSLSPVVCRRAHVLFTLFVFVFTSSCLQEGTCLIYVICVCLYVQLFVGGHMSYLRYLCLSLCPVVCRRAHVLFTLFVFVFMSSCLQEGTCLIYVICVCLYLQLFVGGHMSYLRYLCLSLCPVVCRRAHVLFTLFVFVFTSSCLQDGTCLIYVICVCLYLQLFVGGLMSYLRYLCLSLSPVVCRRAHVLFTLFVFVFISSCLQEGSCLIYVICVCLYLQLFVGGHMSYLRYLCLSLSPVVCRRAHVLFTLFVFVFMSSCLQEGSCLIYVICVCLYVQLFVGGHMSYLRYLCLSLSPVVCRRAHVLFTLFVFVFMSSCLQEGTCLIYVICVCLYLQLFVGGYMSYLRYLCLSLSPVVCRRAHVLFTLFVFVFISSCLQEGSCLIYVICVCLYLQLFVGGLMSYLRYLCLSLPPVVCRRAHVLFTLFVFVFISSCLQEGTCLIYVICVCLYLQLFVGGLMSYLRYLCLSLCPVVCRRAHVLFTLFVFVFTSSCLQEGTCLIYVICVCLYLLLFVGGHMSYLRYLCLSLSPVVCRRAHVLFTLFVFVFTSSCLQEGTCLIYVICVCLYLQLFVGGHMSYLRYLCLSLPPVVCRRAHVLFTLFVFVFISSCLQEGTCLIYVICVCLYVQLFVGGHMSYLRYLCLSLCPVVCRRAHVLFMLFVFVFISSCLQEGTCLIYVICVCLYLQLFVGGHMSYLRYLCLSLCPVVCRRAHVLFTLFVFVFISSCLQEGTCLIYVICVCLYLQLFVGGRLIYVICVCLYLQLFVGGHMSYLRYLCLSLSPVVCRRAHVLFTICVCLYLQLFVGGHMSYLRYLCLSLPPVVCRRAHVLFTLFVFVFTSSCLQEGTCLIYVICVCLYLQLFVGGHMSYLRYLCLSLSPVVCRRAHVLFTLFVFVFISSCLQEGTCLIYVICVCLYLQLFVGGLMSYLRYLCLSLSPVVCRRAHVLFTLFVFVFISSCLQEGTCLIYVICVCLYLQLFVGGHMSYLRYLCLSLSPVVCRRAHVLFTLFVFVFISSCLQEGSCLIYVICVCLYVQLFVGGHMSYLRYLCLSLPPVVCRRAHVLFTLFVFVFTSCCLQEGTCLIYVICVCLYLQLFVGGHMSYLRYLCLSLPPVVCRRAHVLFTLFVFVFISSCLQEGTCLIYVICVCLYLQLFVGGHMSYLRYLCLSLGGHSSCLQEGTCLIYVICVCLYVQLFVGGHMSYLRYLCLSLPPVVCRRAHVLFTLFVFVFMSSCLQEGSCLIYVICVCLYVQLFVGGHMSYLRYLCLSLSPVVCRRAHVLFTLFVFVFISSCLQEGTCLIYVICVCLYVQLFVGGHMSYLRYLCLSLPPVVCRRVLFTLFVFVFISSCLQEGSCLIYVICVCLYLQLFVGGLMSYLRYLCLSLSPVVCRRAHVLFTLFVFVFISSCLQEGTCLIYVICVCLYLQLFVGGHMSYLRYLCLSLCPVVCRRAHVLFTLFVFVFMSSCLQEGTCLINVICVCLYLQLFVGGHMSYLRYLCLSLPPVVCRRAHVLFTLFVFVFMSSCLQEGTCLIYVICVCLYLQLFVGGHMSYLRYLCLSLSPVVCRRAHVLFTLFVFVFISSCLQEGTCLIYVTCVCLYLQLFVGGHMSYLRYLCLSLPPVVCRRAHVLFTLFVFVFTSCCLQEGTCLIYVICVCLYLQLFVEGHMSYLRYLCLSLPPVVCRRAHVLFTLFVFVFTSSCLQEGTCLIYVICVCLYLQLFVGGHMSYLRYLCLSLSPVVCRRAHVLFTLFVFVFISSCLQEGTCLIYVICVCLYVQLFVGGHMSYLRYLCLSLPPVVCRRVHVLFTLFVFVFISSCLQEGSCLIYVICVCLYLQLFVGGLMSYLRYLCLSLSPVVCRRAHVLFTLFVFVFTSSCLQEGTCLIYVICVCLYLQLFVGGHMSYLRYLCLSLSPVVCRRAHVLFTLFVFVFMSSCLQEGTCLIYVICVCLYLQLFVGGHMSYLRYLCLSLPPVVCRRAHVLFTLFVFVFISSCLQEGTCLIYVICVCLYLQLFVGGHMSYLRYLCLSLSPVVCRRAHVLFTLFVFVFTSSCLQEGTSLIYVICVCLYLQLFVGGHMSYLRYLCLSLCPVVCRRAHVLFTLFVFVFMSSCLQEGTCLINVICVCLYLQLFVGGHMSYLRYLCLSLPPVVCRRAHVLFTLFVFVFMSSCLQEGTCLIYVICVCLYLQLFVGGHMSYLRYLCLSLPPVVCRRAHVLFTLFVFVFISSCLQEGTCLIYVICVCLYLQLFVGGHMSYLRYLCLSLSPVVCRRAHVLFTLFVFVFISSCLQEGSCLIYVTCVCLYLQLFVGGHMSYLRYLCLSLSPVVCRRAHVLFTLFVFVFTSSCLQEGTCLIYVICVCLYLQLFVGGHMSYLRYLCLFLCPVVCRRAHVLFTLFVFVFMSSCLQEGTCLIYVICVCLYLQLFVGGHMSYLRYLCLSLSPVVCRGHMSYLRYLCLSLCPVVCRRAHVLFTLFVFVFTSSCLQDGTCLIYVICVCLYLQLFVGGLMSYLRYLCLSLSPVVCRRAHVLFTLFVFVFISSCLQEGSCLIYVICVCLYLQLFVGGHMSYLRYLCLSLCPVVCRRAHVLFTLFVFVFTSSCLQEGTCLIYVICVCLYLQLFVGGLMSYLRYLCLSLSPVVCRRAHVLFTLFVFVFISSCLQEGSCLIYVICVCLYLQLFVGGHMSYLRYLCLSLSPVVCRRAHVLFTLFVFVFISSCLQEGSCLIYVICVCLYVQLFVGGHMSYLRYLCLSLPPVVCRRAHVLFTLFVFVFTSCCLQEGTCLIYVICVCLYLQLFVGGHMSYLRYLCLSLPPVVCRRAHVLFTLFVFVFISSCLQEGTCLIYVICVCLYLQLFVGGHESYLRYLCLSLSPVVCRRAHVLFTLFVFVFMSSCLQEGTCLIYVICVCLYVQLFVGGHMSY